MNETEYLEAYKRAIDLHEKERWGAKRISRAIGISRNTVAGWIYCGVQPRFSNVRYFPNLEMTPTLAYLLGGFLGDGYLRNNVMELKVVSEKFALSFKEALITIGLNPTFKSNVSKNPRHKDTYLVRACSVRFFKWYKSLTFDNIYNLLITPEMKKGFIRGFFEAEGHNRYRPEKRTWEIGFTNYNEQLIALVRKLLVDLGFSFSCHCYYPRYRLSSTRSIQNRDFLLEIKPCIKNKIWSK